MNKEEAITAIAEKTKQAEALIRECEVLANEHEIVFEFSLAYGMGGTFYPKGWDNSGCYPDEDDSGWMSSSQQC